jgi:hypothetical protein
MSLKITKSLLKRKNILTKIQSEQHIHLSSDVICDILPKLGNFYGTITFARPEKSYTENQILYVKLLSVHGDNILVYCKTWIKKIIFSYGYPNPDCSDFLKLQSIVFNTECKEWGKGEIESWVFSCYKIIQTLDFSGYGANKSTFNNIFLESNIRFPKLWNIKVDLIKYDFSENLCFVKLPMLMYIVGSDFSHMRPSYLLNGKYYDNLGKDTLIERFLLCNRLKYKAIITFLLCMKVRFTKDLQRIFANFVLNIPGSFWECLITTQDLGVSANAIEIPKDFRDNLKTLQVEKDDAQNKLNYCKQNLERYRSIVIEHEQAILSLSTKFEETKTKFKIVSDDIVLTLKKRKI